jgi:hypothetical protein
MFELFFGYHGRKINRRARFINGLPGIKPGPQPKKNQMIMLKEVLKVDGDTYYKVKGFESAWFYATRFKEAL